MTYLAHKGMSPLKPDFAAEFRTMWKDTRGGGCPRLNKDMAPKMFKRALASIGIDDTKKLAELLGVTRRNAQNYMKDPATIARSPKAAHYARLIHDRFEEKETLLDMEWSYTQEYIGEAEKKHLNEKTQEVQRMRSLLFRSPSYELALANEYRRRALVTGYEALDQEHRKRLLDCLRLMLSDSSDREARSIGENLKRSALGRKATEKDLSLLVKGTGASSLYEEMQPAWDAFGNEYEEPYAVIDMDAQTYAPGASVELNVLAEYAGIVNPED